MLQAFIKQRGPEHLIFQAVYFSEGDWKTSQPHIILVIR